MIIPDHPYTARELTVCGLIGMLQDASVRTFLNVGMNRPNNPANYWWLKICAENKLTPIVLEAFEPNCRAIHEFGVPNIIHGDVRAVDQIFRDNHVDISLWWHGPEHLAKHEALEALSKLESITRRLMIAGCPKGFEPQDSVYGNEHERHRSAWEREDFEQIGMSTIVVCDGRQFDHITAWRQT